MTKHKNKVNTTLEDRHINLIDQHAIEHNLGGNRSLALRQILDAYTALKIMVTIQTPQADKPIVQPQHTSVPTP